MLKNKPRIAIVMSTYYPAINTTMKNDAIQQLIDQGFSDAQITVVPVPGAVEIPFAAQCCAKQGFDGVIVFGCVIRGETTHYDYVCQQASQGCQQVMLTHHLPVIFGVLTVENEAQAQARVDGTHCHTGIACANTLVRMLEIKDQPLIS
jgi:6,7-dimethyl-8-ribityllumazine synthase